MGCWVHRFNCFHESFHFTYYLTFRMYVLLPLSFRLSPKNLHVKRQTKLYECLENKYECDTAQVRHTHTSTSGEAVFGPAYS